MSAKLSNLRYIPHKNNHKALSLHCGGQPHRQGIPILQPSL